MDGSVFAFTRRGKSLSAYAWWETISPETIGRGQSDLISILPMTPELWIELKSGQTLTMTLERLDAQITHSISEEI